MFNNNHHDHRAEVYHEFVRVFTRIRKTENTKRLTQGLVAVATTLISLILIF